MRLALWDSLRPGVRDAELAAAVALAPAAGPVTDLASPWSQPNHLQSVVWADIFGLGAQRPVTRAEAMAVPAVARARGVLASIVGAIPLRAYRGAEPLAPDAEPRWINQTNGSLPAWHRAVWTLDDLLFYGWSCWSRRNGADKFPLQMDRLPMGRWSVDASGRVKVDRGDGLGHQFVPADSVVLIPGPHEGILTTAQTAIRHAVALQRAVEVAAETPAATTVLKQRSGPQMTEEQIDALVSRWSERRKRFGVAFLNESIDALEMGTFDQHLLIAGRNAAAVDIARACGLPADLLDAAGEHSLTYANVRDNDRRAVSYGAGAYLSAISAQLSQDAVSPRGQRCAFDIEGWLSQAPTATEPSSSNRPQPQPEPAQEPAE